MTSGLWLYSYLALWGLLLLESVLLIAMLRQLKALHSYWVQNDPEWGLPLGALAPALAGGELFGRPVSLAADRGEKTLLLFLSRGCKSCRDTMLHVPSLHSRENLELVLVVRGKALETKLFLAEFRRAERFPDVLVLPDADRALMDQYKVVAVPYAVVVDEDRRVGAKGTGTSPGEIEALIAHAEESRRQRQARADGGELPFFSPKVEASEGAARGA
jgi:hypothetical protein